MLIILSPAKNMKFNKKSELNPLQYPIFKEKTLKIYSTIKNLQPFELESIMKVNPKIALNTFVNFQEFDFEEANSPAILTYSGLAFKGLNALDFSLDELNFANEHLRILSGFYGVLKACDNISAYRLEMQCKLKIQEFKDLYNFWGDLIYKEIFKNNDLVVNLASEEYSKTITPFLKENDKFINIQFLTLKNGKFRTITTTTKTLRGKMARFIIKNKIQDVEDLKDFFADGYKFDSYSSNENTYVFKNS